MNRRPYISGILIVGLLSSTGRSSGFNASAEVRLAQSSRLLILILGFAFSGLIRASPESRTIDGSGTEKEIKGVVVDSVDLHHLVGVKVVLDCSGVANQETTTDAAGAFVFTIKASKSCLIAAPTANNYIGTHVQLAATASAYVSLAVILKLQRAANVSGTIRHSDGSVAIE